MGYLQEVAGKADDDDAGHRHTQKWARESMKREKGEVVVLNQQWPVCFVFIMIPVGSHSDV